MISATARPYIDASVPVLREHGLAITRAFYHNMFAEHPELTDLFNMGNQASGVQQQSLAAAVFAYAANIDNVAALGPVISRIVHKHVSVGIKPAHYPIVGRHLLGAIQEVLGDAATSELIAAWDEAYASLAATLIAAEKQMYADAGIDPGQLREMRVIAIRTESEDVKSYTLEAADDQPLPAFKPGQYLSVAVTFNEIRTQLRQYSLSDAPHPDRLRISVKREAAGDDKPAGQVSNWLHRHLKVGDLLKASHPFGDFTPDAEAATPIVLLSAGVGVTPMISVLNRIAQTHPEREVIFGHAARSAGHHPHRTDLEAAHRRMPNLRSAVFYEDRYGAPQGVLPGRMDVAQLPQWDRGEASVYLCGPVPFMQEQWRALLQAGVPANLIQREVFGPELLDHLPG